MSKKHQTPEYQRNARIVRTQVRALHAARKSAICWRGGGTIEPGQPYDVGHQHGAVGNSLHDLAPEHRHATPGCCAGNRAHGAHTTNLHRRRGTLTPTKIKGAATTWPL
jgi:hypothetical protein